ncbi:DUF6578 domain-containing protein [Streptomyces cyanogenus]|uniref:Uncharacterized protein n=1 Tax=Streptomyces cyanogenus TaxID=80860 RepID=A0ABX7TN40_STRCY|nr:DUF6578 domain-containing protein [Streptomyces cyanogenus]QTD98155.1 hypothetical protein S1361_12410 [Streptomyces cyanogenus]
MERTRVFYAHWQMECCGTPFAVGDEVSWRLVPTGHEDDHYGAAARVENHGGPDPTTGRVLGIDLVHQEFLAHHDPRAVAPPAAEPGEVILVAAGRGLEPVPGAPAPEPVDACPRWFDAFEQEEQPPRRVPYRVRRAVGVLVTLETAPDVPDGTPTEPGDRRRPLRRQ